jgi:hypothetical protein
MKKICKIIWLVAVVGLLCIPGWSAENNHLIRADNLFIAHNGHGDGTGDGPINPDGGDCDSDGPWWDTSIRADNLFIAHNGHGDGDGGGPYGPGDCDGDGPWWDV